MVQVLLGHTKLKNTVLYSRVATKTVRAVISPLDKIMARIKPGRVGEQAGPRTHVTADDSLRFGRFGGAVLDSEPRHDAVQSQVSEKSRLGVLLEHFATIDDPRDIRRIAHPLAEILLLVVCGTMADCDDYDHIAAWGEAHLDFLRRHLPYDHGVPGGRWLTILMNRINPALFSAAFTGWVRETWPNRPDFVAIDGKTSRRSHDRAVGAAPIHLVSAFATKSRLVLG